MHNIAIIPCSFYPGPICKFQGPLSNHLIFKPVAFILDTIGKVHFPFALHHPSIKLALIYHFLIFELHPP